jgi:hypothetical protein
MEQRRIAGRLSDPKEGLEGEARRALDELRANGIRDERLEARLQRVSGELGALGEDALPGAERHLTESRRAPAGDALAPLESAAANVEAVLGGLNSLLEELGAWRSRRDLAGEAADLLATQRELMEETAKAAGETLGTAAGQLSEQQIANLEHLGLRQAGLADRLSRLGEALERLAGEGGPDAERPQQGESPGGTESPRDPSLREPARRYREAGLPASARAAAESIRANEMGDAGRSQRELVERLRETADSIARSELRGPDAERLREESKHLEELAAAQEELLETLRKGGQGQTRGEEERRKLTERQGALREASLLAARRLREANAEQAAASAGEASRAMSDGLEQLRHEDDAAAGRSLDRAAEELRRAGAEAKQTAEGLAARLAEELVATSLGMIAALGERQGAVNEEVARLEAIRVDQGRLSRSQLATLRQTMETQSEVAGETESLAARLRQAPAVSLVLESAAARMRSVEAALGRKETGEAAQRDGAVAMEQLARIAALLEPRNEPRTEADDEGSDDGSGAPNEFVPMLAQLELAASLQKELRERTARLDEERDSGALTSEQLRELERLESEQRKLAAAVRRLVGGNGSGEAQE